MNPRYTLRLRNESGIFAGHESRRLEPAQSSHRKDVFNELNAPYDAKVVGDYTGLSLRNSKLSS